MTHAPSGSKFLIEALSCTPLHFAHIFIQKKEFPFTISQEDWDRWQTEMVRHSMEYLPKNSSGSLQNDEGSFEALCLMVRLLSDVLRKNGSALTSFEPDDLRSMWNKCFFEARIAYEADRLAALLKEGLSEIH